VGDLGPLACTHLNLIRDLTRSNTEWVQVEAARACWTITGHTETAAPVLTTLIAPLADGVYRPAMLTALRYLATIGEPALPAVPVAEAVLANPRRIACNGGWRTFVQDEEIRAAATTLLQAAS